MQLLHFIVGLTIFISTCLSFSADDRVMGWNKAHGLWGKRSIPSAEQSKRTPQNWNKLNSLWGKRSATEQPTAPQQFDVDYELIDNTDSDDVAVITKRNAQWQRANGLWGRK